MQGTSRGPGVTDVIYPGLGMSGSVKTTVESVRRPDMKPPPPGRVVVVGGGGVAGVGGGVGAADGAPGGGTVGGRAPAPPPYPSTTMKYVCPAVTVGVMREARSRPLALAHASSLHPAAISGPLAQTPLRK